MTSIGDAQQREQALDPSRSFIVQAPAGSGKTELLIQRYLKLLGFVEYPEQILAMTFTRKAAAEMKVRILKALENGRSDTPPASEHEKRTWELARKALEHDRKRQWRLLDNASRLRIQTIDSFCRALAVQMPLLTRLGEPPTAEENAEDLYRETARRALQLVESDTPEGEVMRSLLSHLDNSQSAFLQGMIDLLGKRAQWLTDFFQKLSLDEQTKTKLENVLKDLIEDKLNRVATLFPPEIAGPLPALASFSAKNLADANPEYAGACLIGLRALPSPTVADLPQWKALARLLTTDGGAYRKTGGVNAKIGFPSGKSDPEKTMKADFRALLELLEDREELEEALQEIKALPQPSFSDGEWNNLRALILLLSRLAKILRDVFGEHGKTDFTEIILSALDALGGASDPSDLLLKLDMKLQHILVDEYQDTSFKQHQLLKTLISGWMRGDGRSLFLVGDPMQSIYRFRDAEVGLFLDARDKGIGDIQLTPLTLKTNFRSQGKIVAWVNECFGEVFPKADDPILGAIRHSQSQAARPEDDLPGVVLHSLEESKTSEEADSIVELIRGIRANHETESIAVLVRARRHLPAIVHALQENHIPFQAEEIYSLDTRPAILDLLALMRSLLFPQDRLSWLAILRAPWCGLALEDLHRLCHDDTSSPIWALLNDCERLARLSTDGQTRVSRFVAIMANALECRSATNPRDLVEGCWIALGGPACVDGAALQDAEVFFDKISEMIEEGHTDRLEYFESRLKNIYAAAGAGVVGAVNIMTMHKAKGLEFDFVILPGLGKQPRSPKQRLLFWIPHGENLLIAPIQERGGARSEIYDFLALLDKKKESLETFRLLYVAATRAKKQLHLFGHVPIKNGERKPTANSLLQKLWPYVQRQWPPTGAAHETPASGQTPSIRAPVIQRLPADFPGVTPMLQTSSEPEDETSPEFVWAGNQARCLGTVLHLVFQDLAGPDARTRMSAEQLKPALAAALLGEGLPHGQLENAVADALRAIQNMLRDETGQWILKHHRERRSEFPLTGYLAGGYENRVIDRTFVDDNDVRWIIDYKTGEHQGTELEAFFEEEKKRYRRQLREYEQLIRLGGETRDIRKALYYPMHNRLIEIVE
ncbi:MAG: UvrD-helicase domain-containing protein [Nitrospinales bacterium]